MNINKRVLSLLLCLLTVLPLCGCSTEPVQRTVFSMDTVMTLTAYGRNADKGLDMAEKVIQSMNSSLDPKSESSITYQINHAEGENIIVQPLVAKMLLTALEVHDRSGGALDLSVYPLYLAWGEFKEDTARIPGNEELSKLRKLMRFGDMNVTSFTGEANYSLWLPAGTHISFGSVAKGCAAQYAIDVMRDSGVKSGIVSLGGNVQTLGLKPDGSNWTVAVEDPRNTGNYLGTLRLGEAAVVTSGSYQRYFTDNNGQKYHHIIDPGTGKPVENNLLSVTVVCSDGTLADCLSTAMFVLGEKAAMEYWREYGGFDMIMVTEGGKVICTTGLIEVFTLTNTDKYTVSFTE